MLGKSASSQKSGTKNNENIQLRTKTKAPLAQTPFRTLTDSIRVIEKSARITGAVLILVWSQRIAPSY